MLSLSIGYPEQQSLTTRRMVKGNERKGRRERGKGGQTEERKQERKQGRERG